MTLIYNLPAWFFMLLCVLLSCAASAAALRIALARFVGPSDVNHNDVAGPISATIGTVLAVILSFMVAGVWQEYDTAAQTAQAEASAISDLHHLAEGFGEPLEHRLQSSLDLYARTVVEQEWPLMKRGQTSTLAHDRGYDVQRIVVTYRARTPAQLSLQSRAMDLVVIMLDARRNRIFENQQGIPIVLWAAMLTLGAVTVVFSFYFRVQSRRAHYGMVCALAAVIAITFSLIAELDYPFRGDIAVTPNAFTEVLRILHPQGRLHG